jgi:YesN/AraC family two-component response regulator
MYEKYYPCLNSILYLIIGEICGQIEIHEAEDGVQGFKTAAEYEPDVIVSDIIMPGMNGLEFCRRTTPQK